MRLLTRSVLILLPLAAACAAHGPRPTEARAGADPITLQLDYGGAEALMEALHRDSLTDADVDTLLRVPGVRAMVSNITRFVPEVGDAEWRQSIREFVRTKQRNAYTPVTQLDDAWEARDEVAALLTAIRADEERIARETLTQLGPYRPRTGAMAIKVYFIAAGVSEGFVPENAPEPAFYANLVRAQGDLNGVLWNMGHEVYHVLQKTAQRRAGLGVYADAPQTIPLAERMLAETLVEGTANFVASPERFTGPGPAMDRVRERYRRHAEPARVAQNFAAFDRTLAELRAGRMTWDSANVAGFSDHNDARFYFVGFQMAQAIDRYCGAACIAGAFGERPAAFFRRYIALYRAHPEIIGRFSPETEAYVASLP